MKTKPRVLGLGGIFFKATDAPKLRAWYAKHLGLPIDPAWGGCAFEWRDLKDPRRKRATIGSAVEAKTPYFRPSTKPFMVNYQVGYL
ncbi:MAG: hypothetical protein Q8N18_17620 [Opitutaceae bacterium]|nr:hypothetical protein [Opitutaceae bacterium]